MPTKRNKNGVIYLPTKLKINPDPVTPQERKDLAYTRALLAAAAIDAGTQGLLISEEAILIAFQATEKLGVLPIDYQREGNNVRVKMTP
jgi:hypothetical protein